MDYIEFFGIAGLFFLSCQVILAMNFYAKQHEQAYINKLNKNLAFIDDLTGIANRNAFEKDITEINANEHDTILVMIIDINNLKQINDQYGHYYGDKVLENAAQILQKCSLEFFEIKAYRIGGDEFILIAYDTNESKSAAIATYLNTRYQYYKKQNDINFVWAIGYEVAKITSDFNINTFISKVDKKMYIDKQAKKQAVNS